MGFVENINILAQGMTPANITAIQNAGTNAANAAASYNAFANRYLGSKVSAPVLDNDGFTLLVGALYWNSTTSSMSAWNGITWVVLPSSVAASIANVPAGNISSTTVQAALNELDAEKVNNSALLMSIGNINAPLLDMPLKNSLAMKSGVGSATFTRASTATYIDRYGMLKTAAVDTSRFEKEGYLNEGSSTNLFTYSNQFNSAGGWTVAYATTVQTITGPDGMANSAWYLDETTVVGTSYIFKPSFSLTAGTTYTASFFAKKAEDSEVYCWYSGAFFTSNIGRYIKYNFDTKVLTDINNNLQGKSVIELANGWVRISMTFIVDITTSASVNIIGSLNETDTTGSGVYIFGAQLEALPFASSYIPTVASTITRATDGMSISAPNNIGYFMDNWSISFDIIILGVRPSVNGGILYLSGLSSQYMLYITDYGNGSSIICYVNGNTYATPNPTVVYKNKNRITFVLNNGILYGYLNGVLTGSSTIATTAVSIMSPTNIVISDTSAANSYKKISNLRIYDRALTTYEVSLV